MGLDVDLPIHDRRREIADQLQLIVDVAGVAVLAPAAWVRVRSSHPLTIGLGIVEVAAILLACIATARELRGHRRGAASFDWPTAFIGTVLLVEYGFARAAGGKLLSPILITGVLEWSAAILAAPLEARRRKRRRLRIDDRRITLSTSAIRGFVVAWADIEAVRETGERLHFDLHDGSTRALSLARFANSESILRAIREAASAVGVRYRAARELD